VAVIQALQFVDYKDVLRFYFFNQSMQFNLKNRTVKNAGFCAIYSAWGP
jgi:hypothetical protein